MLKYQKGIKKKYQKGLYVIRIFQMQATTDMFFAMVNSRDLEKQTLP